MYVACKRCRRDFLKSPVVTWIGAEFSLASSPITVIEVSDNKILFTCSKCQDEIESIAVQADIRRKYVRTSS